MFTFSGGMDSSLYQQVTVVQEKAHAYLDSTDRLVVVQAPTGFGKTTAVAQWVRSRHHQEPCVWYSVPESPCNEARFWSAMLGCLEAAVPVGDPAQLRHDEAPAASPKDRVTALLERLPGPVLLVVDGFERVDPLVDADLVRLLDRAAGLRIVLCGRTGRQLWLKPSVMGRIDWIGATDLLLRPSQIDQLCELRGVAMTPREQAALWQRTRGCAGLVSAAVDGLDRGLDMRQEVVAEAARYLDAHIAMGPGLPRWLDVLAELSVPEILTADAARLLFNGTDHAVLLGGRNAGLTFASVDPALDGAVEVLPALREVLLERLRSADPERLNWLDRRFAHWYLEQDQPAAALRHAMRASDIELCLRIVDRFWFAVPELPPSLVRQSLGHVPRHKLDEYPIAQLARSILFEDVDTLPTEVVLPSTAIARLKDASRREGLNRALDLGIAQLTTMRLHSDHDNAANLAAVLYEESAKLPRCDGVRDDREARLMLEIGMAHQLVGNHQRADPPLRRAYAASAHGGHRTMKAECARHLSLNAWLAGNVNEAERWLGLSRHDTGCANRLPADLLRLLIALSRLDKAAAEAALSAPRHEPAWERDDFWFLPAFARSTFDLLWADRNHGLSDLGMVHHRYASRLSRNSRIRAILQACEMNLMLAADRVAHDRILPEGALGETMSPSRILAAAEARQALVTGRPEHAYLIAARASTGSGFRMLDELTVLQAVALLRLSSPSQAAELTRDMLRRRRDVPVSPLSFALIPRDDLRSLAALVPEINRYLQCIESAGVRQIPAHVALVRLTRREGSVVRLLARGATLETVAKEHFVSLNTVKSQVQSVYRKLGVSDRLTAVTVARDLGFLDE